MATPDAIRRLKDELLKDAGFIQEEEPEESEEVDESVDESGESDEEGTEDIDDIDNAIRMVHLTSEDYEGLVAYQRDHSRLSGQVQDLQHQLSQRQQHIDALVARLEESSARLSASVEETELFGLKADRAQAGLFEAIIWLFERQNLPLPSSKQVEKAIKKFC